MTAIAEAPTARLVTPTARLVLPATASRAEWLEGRRAGIGASDVPAILGVCDFGTPRKVYYSKTGMFDDQAGEAALWGNIYEEPIAQEWARRNRSVVEPIGLVAHIDDPVLMCTLDRRITECPLPETRREVCALEIKCRSAFKSTRWSDGPPDDVLAQTLYQLAVTGFDHVHYAVLIGGNDYRQGVIRAAEYQQLMGDIVTAVRRFWDEYVVRQVVPPQSANGGRELAMYKAMHSDRDGVVHLDMQPEVLDALDAYETARLAEKDAKERKELAYAELLRLLGSHEVAVLGGEKAYSMEPRAGRPACDFARLAERYPEAYRECVKRTPFEQLDIDKRYKRTPGKESN